MVTHTEMLGGGTIQVPNAHKWLVSQYSIITAQRVNHTTYTSGCTRIDHIHLGNDRLIIIGAIAPTDMTGTPSPCFLEQPRRPNKGATSTMCSTQPLMSNPSHQPKQLSSNPRHLPYVWREIDDASFKRFISQSRSVDLPFSL